MRFRKIMMLMLVWASAFSFVQARELVSRGHPRLLMDDASFAQMREKIDEGSNEALLLMHRSCMSLADECGLAPSRLRFEKDASGKRLLAVSRLALARIFADAYAYRYSGDARYLEHAEQDILDVCAFHSWNPSHYLDVGEMAAAVALGYDWLYHELRPETRAKALDALRRLAFDSSADPRWNGFYRATNNWSPVCNAGLVCAALATYEENPAVSDRIIDDAVRTVRPSLRASYAPDGNYAEGPAYWEYGTSFQVLMNAALESCLGGDQGLGQSEGLDRTGEYMLMSLGTSMTAFNFSDNSGGNVAHAPMWYFASRFGRPDVLFNELKALREGLYARATDHTRLLPMFVRYAAEIDVRDISEPRTHVYAGRGCTPVVLARSSWTDTPGDRYLGIKGGRASNPHGHMDAGTFVYDAYGMRWAMDLGGESYATMEVAFAKTYGNGFWARDQKASRWKVFRYHNRQHNTLTVNDHDHDVLGFAPVIGVMDEPQARGGVVDLTAVFGGDLSSAVRTALIRDGEYLEIRDRLEAPASRPASVRWSMVTAAQVTVTEDGILLSQGGETLILRASGADLTYRSWSADPRDYDSPLAPYERLNEGCTVCGFTLELAAGEAVELVTELKHI